MAGNYPDVPAPRMAYDVDGTRGYYVNSSTLAVTSMSASDLTNLNDETSSRAAVNQSSYYYVLFFPQLRDIAGMTYWAGNIQGFTMQYSTDTTNGVDGTWTNTSPQPTNNLYNTQGHVNSVDIRKFITTMSLSGVKALRSTPGANGGAEGWFIYENISANQSPDRLRSWHPTLDQSLDDSTSANGAYLDWGDVTQGTSQDRTFRIKNNSSSLTANNITISTSVLSDATVALGPQVTYSNGGAFATSINIGNLAPNAISPVITIRRTTAANADLSLWTWRTIANAASWT